MRFALALGAGCVLMFASPALAAEAQTGTPAGTFYLHTGTRAGMCKSWPVGDGLSSTIECSDGANRATLTSDRGCLESSGSGYCGRDIPWSARLGGSQLNCPHGVSYFLFSGVAADNQCHWTDGAKLCETTDHTGSASASCADGCDDTASGGDCCNISTPGCPSSFWPAVPPLHLFRDVNTPSGGRSPSPSPA